MSQEIKTFELAKVYESQGYFEDAMKIYRFLDTLETSDEIKAGLKRMEEKMDKKVEDKKQNTYPEKNISGLFEKWLRLMLFEQRLDKLKKIRSRLL